MDSFTTCMNCAKRCMPMVQLIFLAVTHNNINLSMVCKRVLLSIMQESWNQRMLLHNYNICHLVVHIC